MVFDKAKNGSVSIADPEYYNKTARNPISGKDIIQVDLIHLDVALGNDEVRQGVQGIVCNLTYDLRIRVKGRESVPLRIKKERFLTAKNGQIAAKAIEVATADIEFTEYQERMSVILREYRPIVRREIEGKLTEYDLIAQRYNETLAH